MHFHGVHLPMSSRGRRQTGFEHRVGDHRGSHHPVPQRDNEYAESELSYISAFEDLNLNGAQYPTTTMSPSRVQNLPAGPPYHDLSPRAETSSAQGNMRSMEPLIEHRIDTHNSLGLVSANYRNSLPAEVPHGSPSRPLRQSLESPYNNHCSSRQGGYATPSWWQSPSDFARPHERGFRGYPEEDRLIGSRRTDVALQCQCRTCVEHRHVIRNWAISRYDDRSMPPRSNFYPYMYPPRRGQYPTEVDWLNRDEDYSNDSPDNDSDYSSYESDSAIPNEYRNYAFPDTRQPNQRTVDLRDAYYQSDHEDSDGTSYAGYEGYDEYGDYSD